MIGVVNAAFIGLAVTFALGVFVRDDDGGGAVLAWLAGFLIAVGLAA